MDRAIDEWATIPPDTCTCGAPANTISTYHHSHGGWWEAPACADCALDSTMLRGIGAVFDGTTWHTTGDLDALAAQLAVRTRKPPPDPPTAPPGAAPSPYLHGDHDAPLSFDLPEDPT